ncbi:hypothetical protein GUITHDRAFT_153160 [Guillardia theta CCMP2712]|uniref:Uncharacterized protein n=2 Tax=Guillardia theta TaxID=55529 RepID=L1J5Z2_GUITC|nr:hypothetical protein GUITHDRAFT_153160 [Guillardia theta CCMP2712]EKX43742.1 hypothetical protein GUITHDRAFT_153160 [Guillardia theta CCMP2712]|eukprot:XP_005830722.1 hypothetical protein GUITHDRAFT_153160 [Guillardia theta CCMP2712]
MKLNFKEQLMNKILAVLNKTNETDTNEKQDPTQSRPRKMQRQDKDEESYAKGDMLSGQSDHAAGSEEDLNEILFQAAEDDNLLGVEDALQRGADVNFGDRNCEGNTALHFLAFRNNTDGCVLVCSHGADVNAQNDFGETPLHLAAARNLPEMCRCLADLGANLGIREQGNLTALKLAYESGNEKSYEALYTIGAPK